jgi:hypothetical protein
LRRRDIIARLEVRLLDEQTLPLAVTHVNAHEAFRMFSRRIYLQLGPNTPIVERIRLVFGSNKRISKVPA